MLELAAISAAAAAILEVQMKVVAVRPVGIGAENRAEFAAGIVMNGAQKAPFAGSPAPALLDQDLAAALEREGRNVDGIAIAVLTHPGATHIVARPAGIGSRDIDSDDALAKLPPSRRLHGVLEPHPQWLGHAAIQRGRLTERYRPDRFDRPGVAHLAAVAFMDVTDLGGLPDPRWLDIASPLRRAKAFGLEIGFLR